MSHVPLLCFQKGFELPPVRMQRHTQGKGGVLHAFVPALRLGLKRLDERAPPILEYVPVPGPASRITVRRSSRSEPPPSDRCATEPGTPPAPCRSPTPRLS
ncbi:MAG: hypothetical protein ACLR7Z_21200 [Bilophila wadsworthia]